MAKPEKKKLFFSRVERSKDEEEEEKKNSKSPPPPEGKSLTNWFDRVVDEEFQDFPEEACDVNKGKFLNWLRATGKVQVPARSLMGTPKRPYFFTSAYFSLYKNIQIINNRILILKFIL